MRVSEFECNSIINSLSDGVEVRFDIAYKCKRSNNFCKDSCFGAENSISVRRSA